MKFYSNRLYFKTVILTLVFLLSISGLAFAKTSKTMDYVALGDSLTVGYTPYQTQDKSYTDIIAEKLNEEGVLGYYQNLGYPGYTTNNVLASINPLNPDNDVRVSSISNAELITLNIGANDLLDLIPDLLSDPTQAPVAIGSVANNIAQITFTLKGINPNAKIYLMGYYNAFPNSSKEEQAQVIPLILGFNEAIKAVATLTGATYVDTYTTMDKHSTKYLPEEDIHPTISGYRAIAKEFWNIIKVDFLRGEK